MIFGKNINEVDTSAAEDKILQTADPETAEGIEAIADEVEQNMLATAMESMTFFTGGEEAYKSVMESAEMNAYMEAKMAKKTIMRLNKNDDLTRRSNLASLIMARNANDPLWKKLALNRVKERQLRTAIFNKYGHKAQTIAKRSQQKHLKTAKTILPIKFN